MTLAAAHSSYVDTQISRLVGPTSTKFDMPRRARNNTHRDGMHRQAIARGRVAYNQFSRRRLSVR